MISVYDIYKPDDIIPIDKYIKSKKAKKYYNKETQAAITAVGKLLEQVTVDRKNIPIYYATGLLEYADYGLRDIAENSLDKNRKFSLKNFIEKGLLNISPLNQFKVLQNMPLCFIAIEYGFNGDNAVVYSSLTGLLHTAVFSDKDNAIIGAGKIYKDGSVEVGFASVTREEIKKSKMLHSQEEAVVFFRNMNNKENK